MSDIFGSLAPETDALVPPPRNPAAPPDMVANAVRAALQHNLDWAKFPGRVMQGVQPSTPGQWSEEDEYRAQDLARRASDWGAQTAFSDVFWPRSGGASALTSGAGSRTTIPPRIGPPSDLPRIMERDEFPKIAANAWAAPFDPRGPWGQSVPKRSAADLYFSERPYMSPSTRETDSALASIQSALKSGRGLNSGVPLVPPNAGANRSTDDILALIEEALKLAPRKE